MQGPKPLEFRTFWRTALEHWDDVTAVDLHQTFGIDVLDGITAGRPWWWLRARIIALLDDPSTRLFHMTREAAS